MRASFLVAAALALSAAPLAARAQHREHSGHCGDHHRQTASPDCDHAARTADGYEIAVTPDGFVPSSIQVKRGEPVRLVVTRTTDQTCAKEIVIDGYGIEKALPLGEPVTIEFTPKRSGRIRYACAMGMVRGALLVE